MRTISENILHENPDYVFMVEQAIKAPSGHNTQPWLFQLHRNFIEIFPDFEKSLNIVDPDHRELFISLGCATENLCIAAAQKGYSSHMEISGRHTIRIFLSQADVPENESLLYKQIARRQTNRNVYSGETIAEGEIDMLKKITLEEGVKQYFLKNGTEAFQQTANYVLAGNSLQMNDMAFKEELKTWMRYNKRHEKMHNDGLSYATFGAPNLPRIISQFVMTACLTPYIQNKGDRKKIASSSHFVLFTLQENTPGKWILLGRNLQRFLLKTTEAGISCAFLNQPCESEELAARLQSALGIAPEYPELLLRIGYADPLPYSPRKQADEVIRR